MNTTIASPHNSYGVWPTVASGYNFTISFWVNPRSVGGASSAGGLWQLEDASGNDVISLFLNGLGVGMRFNGNPATLDSSLGNISLNTWNNIIFQMQDNAWTITVNGTTNVGTTAAIPDFTTIAKWRVGRATDNSATRPFDGLMADMMVALTYANFTERTVLYNNGATFNLAQNVLAPNNPLMAQMTFLLDGTDTGTPNHLPCSRLSSTSVSPNLKKSASLAWTGTLQNCPELDATSRPAAAGTDYTRLARLYQSWDNNLARTTFQGTSIRPLPVGGQISVDAPALGAWPFSGYGVKTDSSSFVGAVDAPQATPRLTVSGTLTEQGTASNPMVGSGTLQGSLDARECRFLRPTFAAKF